MYEVPLKEETVKFEDVGSGLRADSSRDVWRNLRCENSRPDLEGERVRFMLVDEKGWPLRKPNYQDRIVLSLEWFVSHEAEVRDASLDALVAYIRDVLVREYSFDDPELLQCNCAEDVKGLVDLSFVRLFPHSKDELPFYSLEFECSWDPEHGCGVMLHGLSILDIGGSDSAQSPEAIESYGGEI